MTEAAPRSLVSRLSQELMILSVIVCVTMLLMNIRVDERYIEANRAVLMYTTDVAKADALRLSTEMSERGLYNGQPHAFSLARPDDTWEFCVMASPETLQSTQNQQLLAEFFRPVCRTVFGDDPVRVHLTDDELTPQLLLLELP